MYVKPKKTGLEGILSKIKNKALPIILAPIIALASYGIAKADYDLKFYHAIGNDPTIIAPDNFYAIGSNLPGVLVGKDTVKDLLEVDLPGGDYVQAYTTVEGYNLAKDGQPFDVNLPDNTWLVKLNAFDDPNWEGLSGTARFNLANPSELNELPPYALALAQRQTSTGTPIQNYNLDETPNISWPVTSAQNIYAKMELKVIDEYLRIKNLYPTEQTINFKHFAVFANKWQNTGPIPEDINGNNKVDYQDLEIIARNWLYDGN